MIVTKSWPLTKSMYVQLKLAGRIRYVPTDAEIAADMQRAVERDRERAVRQAEAIVRGARG